MTIPDTQVLRTLAVRCRSEDGVDRLMDAQIWSQLGWTQRDNQAKAWRDRLALSPRIEVNGRSIGKSIEMFPHDAEGIGRCWNIPRFTQITDAAESLLGEPEHPFAWSTMSDFGGLRRCRVWDGEKAFQSDASSIPRAICATALDACAWLIDTGRPLPLRNYDWRLTGW